MIYYNRIYVSEGIDVNKTSASNECIICNYWCFLNKGCRFQPTVCDGCHDVLMMSIDINNINILNIHGIDCMLLSCHVRISG